MRPLKTLKMRPTPWRTAVALLAALLALPVAGAGALSTTSRQITLRPSTAYPTARGTAQYQRQPGQREIQLEVEHIRSLAGQRVVISVNGATLGTARVSSRGVAELDRNTERGQRVPTIHAGTTLKVQTSGGAMIVSGTF